MTKEQLEKELKQSGYTQKYHNKKLGHTIELHDNFFISTINDDVEDIYEVASFTYSSFSSLPQILKATANGSIYAET